VTVNVVWWGTTNFQRCQFIWYPGVGIIPMGGWPRQDQAGAAPVPGQPDTAEARLVPVEAAQL